MATSTSRRTPCAICGKITGSFTCRGCQKDFCSRHVLEHRQELGKQMDELTDDHNRLLQHLMRQNAELQHYHLMKQIDEWEKQSIEKIRFTADKTRKQLQNTIKEHTAQLTEGLAKIAEELRIAREEDHFFETDLKHWMKKLDELNNHLSQPSNIQIVAEDNGNLSLTTNFDELVVQKECFDRCVGNIQIRDHGQVIIKTIDNNPASVNGLCEYTSGQHRIRFKIEEYNPSKWIFIGIISKTIPMEMKSYGSQSSYGWAGGDQVYLNGTQHPGSNGYTTDLKTNDIVELFIDCDQRILRLINERAQSSYRLEIDRQKCPYPWQISFGLYWKNDRVKILQA